MSRRHSSSSPTGPAGRPAWCSTTTRGIRDLVRRCQALAPALIVLQATGGYEAAVVAALAAAQFPVVVAHPRQVRGFAKATGQLAKTDALDAHVLALYAERVRPTPRPLPEAAVQASMRSSPGAGKLVEMLTAERNRIPLARPPVRRDLEQHIRFLERRVRGADDDLHTAVKASPAWRVKDNLLQSADTPRRFTEAASDP